MEFGNCHGWGRGGPAGDEVEGGVEAVGGWGVVKGEVGAGVGVGVWFGLVIGGVREQGVGEGELEEGKGIER